MFLLLIGRRSRDTYEKTPSEPAGRCDLLRVLRVLSRRTRAKMQSPKWRIFSLSARGGSACGDYRVRGARCQRNRRGDSRGRNLSAATLRVSIFTEDSP